MGSLCEEDILNRRDNKAQESCAPPPQGASNLIRPVGQLLDGVQNTVTRLFADMWVAGKDPANRSDRDAGMFCDILDRGHKLCSNSWVFWSTLAYAVIDYKQAATRPFF